MKKFIILTLFPEIIEGFLDASLVKRAIKKKIIEINLVNLRDFGLGKHRQVDDRPYGGGPGMIIRVDVMHRAISNLQSQISNLYSILLDPKGKTFDQKQARRLAKDSSPILLICGRYEGFDARVDRLVDEKISLGNFILSGGEVAAMALIEAISRLLPNFLSKKESLKNESHNRLQELEYPQYTKPQKFQNMSVPKILLTGNHQNIARWRQFNSIDKKAGSR